MAQTLVLPNASPTGPAGRARRMVHAAVEPPLVRPVQAVQIAADQDAVLVARAPQAATAPSVEPVSTTEWKDRLADLIERFEAAEDASRSNRQRAERDVDYYDGKQWTDAEVKELKKRGQPAITFPLIKQKIDYLQGLERVQRTDPKALPRTPQHEEDAHAATDALRAVCDQARFPQVRSRVAADLFKVGWGGVEVTVEMQPPYQNPRVVVRRCAWDRMWHDPHSSEPDFSDAAYQGLVVWMDRDEAVRTYGPNAAKVFDETVALHADCGSYDDRPTASTWLDRGKRNRVRVVQAWFKNGADGKWWFAEYTKGGFLKAGESPFLDENGEPEHPYVWRSSYIDRENNRYGEIRAMIDLQDEVNKRRSKALHAVSTRQTFAGQGTLGPKSARDMRSELAKPDGHVELAPGKEFGKDFGIIPTNDLAQGQFELLQQAIQQFQSIGPNASMLGKGSSSASGRAILAQQQGGAVQVDPVLDLIRDLDHAVYAKIWRRIRQFWTAEEWVRVTDRMENVRFVGLNVPVTDAYGQPVAVQNEVAQLDIDIIIDDAPSVGTMQDEEFGKLVELAQVGVVMPPAVYVMASNLRSKTDILSILQQGQAPDPMAQAGAELEVAKGQAEAEATMARARRDHAQAEQTEMTTAAQAAQAAAMGQVVPFPGAFPGR